MSFLYFLQRGIKVFRTIPIAIYEPKSSLVVFATLIAFVINTTYIITTKQHAINPASSPITGNIKSVVFGYKNPHFGSAGGF